MIPLIPALLLGGGSWFGWKELKRRKALTPERKAVFEKAINTEDATPTYLRSLADAFQAEGLVKEAKLLRQRAALKEAPPEVKAKRREIFAKAMQSTNPDAILEVARAHEQIGATGAAEALKAQAEAVRAVKDA
jgi:hypothetical protein